MNALATAVALLAVGLLPAIAAADPGDSLLGPAAGAINSDHNLEGPYTGSLVIVQVRTETQHWRNNPADPGYRVRILAGFSVPLNDTRVAYSWGGPSIAAVEADPEVREQAEKKREQSGRPGTVSMFALASGTIWSDTFSEGFDFGRVGLNVRLNSTLSALSSVGLQLAITFPFGDEQRQDLHNVTSDFALSVSSFSYTMGAAWGGRLTVGRGIGRDPYTRVLAIAELTFGFGFALEFEYRYGDNALDAGRLALAVRIPGDQMFMDLRFRLVGPLGSAMSVSIGGRFW